MGASRLGTPGGALCFGGPPIIEAASVTADIVCVWASLPIVLVDSAKVYAWTLTREGPEEGKSPELILWLPPPLVPKKVEVLCSEILVLIGVIVRNKISSSFVVLFKYGS